MFTILSESSVLLPAEASSTVANCCAVYGLVMLSLLALMLLARGLSLALRALTRYYGCERCGPWDSGVARDLQADIATRFGGRR